MQKVIYIQIWRTKSTKQYLRLKLKTFLLWKLFFHWIDLCWLPSDSCHNHSGSGNLSLENEYYTFIIRLLHSERYRKYTFWKQSYLFVSLFCYFPSTSTCLLSWHWKSTFVMPNLINNIDLLFNNRRWLRWLMAKKRYKKVLAKYQQQ